MRTHIPGRYAALALLLGGLACAGNKAGSDDGTVVAQDSTQANDTSAYQGQQRDTTAIPAPTTTDSTMDLPSSKPADTSSYAPAAPATPVDTNSSSGIERADTLTGQPSSASPDSSAQPSTGSSTDTTAGMTRDSAGKATPQ